MKAKTSVCVYCKYLVLCISSDVINAFHIYLEPSGLLWKLSQKKFDFFVMYVMIYIFNNFGFVIG